MYNQLEMIEQINCDTAQEQASLNKIKNKIVELEREEINLKNECKISFRPYPSIFHAEQAHPI